MYLTSKNFHITDVIFDVANELSFILNNFNPNFFYKTLHTFSKSIFQVHLETNSHSLSKLFIPVAYL